MDWLDYREKLGIGFADVDKQRMFFTKTMNMLKGFCGGSRSKYTVQEYFNFCQCTGTVFDTRYTDPYLPDERYFTILTLFVNHQNNLNEFWAYYLAFINTLDPYRTTGVNAKRLIEQLKTDLEESHIPYNIVSDKDGIFVFPKGVPEFDATLVSQPLDWLHAYPTAQAAWIKALKKYADHTPDESSDVADLFRKAMETFFQSFFKTEGSLENRMKEYSEYLKGRGIPQEIANNFKVLMEQYNKFMNNYAKHHDRTSDKVLEYIMYQTGNIIRLLITLKQSDEEVTKDES